MKKLNMSSSANTGLFVTTLLLLVLAVFGIGFFIINTARTNHYKHMKEDALTIARVVARSLSTTAARHDTLDGITIRSLFEELQYSCHVNRMSLIDNNFTITASTDEHTIGETVTKWITEDALSKRDEYVYTTATDGERRCVVCIPIPMETISFGTLVVESSVRETDAVISRISTFGTLILVIVFVSLACTMAVAYHKSARLTRLAYYDEVTNLPNARYMEVFLAKEIKTVRNGSGAIMLISCDDFRTMSMRFGLTHSEQLRNNLGDTLRGYENDTRTLFRLSSDRFVFFMKNYRDEHELISFAKEISGISGRPFLVKGTEQYLCIKIGIVKLEGRNESIERLLKAAMVSLNFVRRNGSEHFAFFDEEMEKRLVRDDQIENELRTELSGSGSQSLYLEYQPVVNGKTNDITGFEALVRMRSTHLGQIPPVEFIDVGERRQLILPLGMWVLRKVCAFIRRLNARGRSGVAVAVNISGLQLLRDDFIPTVLELIKANGIDGSSIVFEITESVLLDNYDLINRRLNELREHGIRIALDDFGTGYSSFSRLSELNIDIAKIDKFFIDRIRRKERGALITGTIISIAHQLGLSVVAEGVEIEQQRRYLMNEGCDLMQGFLFSKSLSETDAFSSLEIGSIETMFSSIRD